MEVELVTDGASEDENFGLDCNPEDYMNFEGERCGICMDVVVDQGVLDCCQHWFCFTCIDNWSTITSLCPICQSEFQLITCVPVYDTARGSQTDDESNLSDDDWFIEGKNSALSFPSYYIDENAVLCLGKDGCKIRSGSVAFEEESDIDTSIACDSCDKWYHAFCVGFDPEGSCDNSWLCPRCTCGNGPQKADGSSTFLNTHQHVSEFVDDDTLAVSDEADTAVTASLVDGQPKDQESDECLKDGERTLPLDSVSNALISEALQIYGRDSESEMCQNEMEVSPSVDKCGTSSLSLLPDRSAMTSHPHLVILDSEKNEENGTDVDNMSTPVEQNNTSIVYSPARDTSIVYSPARDMALDKNEAFSPIVHYEEEIVGTPGGKRKLMSSSDADNEEADFTYKKFKADGNSPPTNPTELPEAALDDSHSVSSPEEDDTFDIMDIVKEKDRRSDKQHQDRESNGGFKLKKIMRVAGDENESSLQELREQILEAVHNKSSGELEKNLFDPKLLVAFRAALTGSSTENRKQTVDLKARRSFLQKGKVRESLTKKIYGQGGKRRRAWTRDCDVEFWKHRCIQGSKPEKLETLKAVLDMLRDGSESVKLVPEKQEEEKPSLLGRLYLADTSVFPRKDDVVPLSAIENGTASASNKSLDANPQQRASASSFPSGSDALKKRDSKRSHTTAGQKKSTEKEKPFKSEIEGDKRKWALQVLARKTEALGNSAKEKDGDSAIDPGNFPLMAQLPTDMKPVLASSRHNKIPIPVRQAQLYRLAEQFLKKLKLSAIRRTAETELAVADAVNIEKQVADRSNSKLVYLNLCSQELQRRSDDPNCIIRFRVQEPDPCSTSGHPSIEETRETDNFCSFGSEVDEALRKAGLLSDSPPNSPKSDCLVTNTEEKADTGGPNNVVEVVPPSKLVTYEDFECDLEDAPKIKGLVSSLKPKKQDAVLCHPDPVLPEPVEPKEVPNVVNSGDNGHDQEEAQPCNAECEDDNATPVPPPSENAPKQESLGDTEEAKHGKKQSKDTAALAARKIESPSENAPPKQESLEHSESNSSTTHHTKQSRDRSKKVNPPSENAPPKQESLEKQSKDIAKKVEAFIKEHLRPLCKSGVITVEDYRWAVGKTTEKVMKYHSKEKNASFLIREGEKVKKLAAEYVETAPHQNQNRHKMKKKEEA